MAQEMQARTGTNWLARLFGSAPVPAAPAAAAKPLSVGVSISRKINLGNYESAEVWLSITGIEAGTTVEDIKAALETGALGYNALKPAIVAKIHDLRAKNGEA